MKPQGCKKLKQHIFVVENDNKKDLDKDVQKKRKRSSRTIWSYTKI